VGERQALGEIASWLGGDIEAALGQIRVPAYVLDANGVVRWANARAVELFGDFTGHSFRELVAPEASPVARTEFTKKLLGKTRTSDYESTLLLRSGRRLPVEVHSVALTDGGRVVGVFGIAELDPLRSPMESAPPAELTPRQYESLHLLARGYSTAQMAQLMGLSPETVRNHVRGLLRALRAHSRLEAVAEGRRRGLVD
jgi:PAS domain S-box-containing protein